MTLPHSPALLRFREQIIHATNSHQPLNILGSGSKNFYGEPKRMGETLNTREHSGIVAYDPAELVITARCGTSLQEIEQTLAAHQQILPFEPPHFGEHATIGGAVAAGLAGPRRAHVGSVKDFVLGVDMLNGNGDWLHFGGTVVKNVAGYDVARLLAGSMGILGLITEVSIKVLPKPFAEATLALACSAEEAPPLLNRLMGQPLPLSASLWATGVLYLRLSGTEAGVDTAIAKIGGTLMANTQAQDLWLGVREQDVPLFDLSEGERLWRVSVPDTTPVHKAGLCAMEWGSGLRWYKTAAHARTVRALAQQAGGHATLFRGAPEADETVFTPPSKAVMAIQQRLKRSFDPSGIFNVGRLYPDL